MEERSRRGDHRRHRSRSSSLDSEAEGRRDRRRKGRTEREERRDDAGGRADRDRRPELEERRVRDRAGETGSSNRRHRDEEEPDKSRRRSRSPADDHDKRRHDNRSSKHRSRADRSPKSRDRDSRSSKAESTTQVPVKKSGPLPSQEASFSMNKDPSMALTPYDEKPVPEKQKPNFAPTGLLAAETNKVEKADGTAIVLKYHEPPEARKPPPRDQWKLFVFKGAEIVDTIELSLRSCWLIGREVSIVDMLAEHPSISKQHAVLQFRYIEKRNEFGDKLGRVRPYLIDLESANGTMLNKEPIPGSRYLELRDKDMIQFGDSTREYVLMLPPKD